MNNLKVLDIGSVFGFDMGLLFQPWNATVVVPTRYDEIKRLISTLDLVCFGGGQDISPSLYGHTNVASHTTQTPSNRDLFEIEVWKLARREKIPVFGICRGAQFICAMSGGSLIQDVAGHPGHNHPLETKDGEVYEMTSTHHQMMFPHKTKHDLIAWVKSDNPAKRAYQFDKTKMQLGEFTKEPEVVYFPDTNALAIQGHPEYYDPTHRTSGWVRQLIHKHLLEKRPYLQGEDV